MEIDKKTPGEAGIRMVERGERYYPARLLEIPDPPERLYVLGRLPEEKVPSVAIIGARECSEYGSYVAARLGECMGRNGIQVISGMARGIDGIGQTAALDAGGSSFAVLGSGVDVCYPARNRRLYERLRERGGVLSEYPPGTPALSRNFPPRNRIVSGLADAVVVVEAREKSGTLITVDMALEQGKEVYAVPGRVTDALSSGCNRLVKLGAAMLLDPEELAEELRGICGRRDLAVLEKVQRREPGRKQGRHKGFETAMAEGNRQLLVEKPLLAEIFRQLELTPKSVDRIRAALPQEYRDEQINVYLIRLCMEKLAVQVSPGQFCRAGN